MTTTKTVKANKFEQLLNKELGSARLHKDEWNLAANNVEILTEKDLRYFCRLAQVKKYSRMKRVEKIAALQPSFDKHNVNKVEVKQEVKEVKQETKKRAEQETKQQVKKETKKTKGRKPLDIKPKGKEEVKAIRSGTKLHRVALLVKDGATIEQLMEATGYSAQLAKGTMFHENLTRRKGYGIKQDGDKYYLVFPEGMNELVIS